MPSLGHPRLLVLCPHICALAACGESQGRLCGGLGHRQGDPPGPPDFQLLLLMCRGLARPVLGPHVLPLGGHVLLQLGDRTAAGGFPGLCLCPVDSTV